MSDPIEVLLDKAAVLEKVLPVAREYAHAPEVREFRKALTAALASLSAPKPDGEWVELAKELQALIDGAKGRAFNVAERAGLMIRVAALNDAARMAPKPESVEAVGEVFGPKAVSTMVALERPLPPGTKVYTAPPRPEASAPVGVELREAAEAVVADHTDYSARVRLRKALAQQPAYDGGFTAADMMDARQEGRKEAQQPAAVDPEDIHVELYPEQFGGFRTGSPRGIKITHRSGLIVASTKERSAHANRDVAMRALAHALAGQQQGGA